MGLGLTGLKILMQEGRRRPFSGTVLTLGRQDCYFSRPMMLNAAVRMGFALKMPAEAAFSPKPLLAARGYVSDAYALRSLGFSSVQSLDVSSFEACDHVFDLNSGEIPASLAEAYDVVIDGGTLEHVFHVPNALRNIGRMLKENGRIIHFSPSSNYLDHGFYMFSPTLFRDYYTANRFDLDRVQLMRTTSRIADAGRAALYDCKPGGGSTAIEVGELDDAIYSTVCIATKTKGSTSDAIPQQGYYTAAWKNNAAARPRRLGALKDAILRSRFLFTAVQTVRYWFRSKRLRMKPVERL